MRFWEAFWAAAILLWGFAAVAEAGQPALTITPAGYYLTELAEDGSPRYVRIETVIDLTDGDAPDQPDQPDVDGELVRDVRGWADAVDDPQGAQAIAAVYSQVRGAGLSADDALSPLKSATDCALQIAGQKDWSAFRKKLSAEITERKQRGTLQTAGQVETLLASVQAGLELAADGSDALSTDTLTQIQRKTQEAIDDV